MIAAPTITIWRGNSTESLPEIFNKTQDTCIELLPSTVLDLLWQNYGIVNFSGFFFSNLALDVLIDILTAFGVFFHQLK